MAVAVGAAAGAVVGHFAGHKLTTAIQSQVAAALKDGTAVIIGVFPAEDRLAVEQALPGPSGVAPRGHWARAGGADRSSRAGPIDRLVESHVPKRGLAVTSRSSLRAFTASNTA